MSPAQIFSLWVTLCHHKTLPCPGDQGHQLGRVYRQAEEAGWRHRTAEAATVAEERDPIWKELQQGRLALRVGLDIVVAELKNKALK